MALIVYAVSRGAVTVAKIVMRVQTTLTSHLKRYISCTTLANLTAIPYPTRSGITLYLNKILQGDFHLTVALFYTIIYLYLKNTQKTKLKKEGIKNVEKVYGLS